MAVFAIVSCKNEVKKQEPEPEPEVLVTGTEEDILAGNAFYRLIATREAGAKRFALQYLVLAMKLKSMSFLSVSFLERMTVNNMVLRR